MSTPSPASSDAPSPVPADATVPPGAAPPPRIAPPAEVASPVEVARPAEIAHPPAVPRPSGPADTAHADTTPADTTPADTTPADTPPADTTPADVAPADATPAGGGATGVGNLGDAAAEASPPPAWLRTLAGQLGEALVTGRTRPGPRAADARPAAVLILFGDGPHGPDVLLLERSAELRSHASQPAFPGGAADATDATRVDTALREAAEEVGLDPAGVEVLAVASPLYLQASHYLVTPVLAWWHTPCAVAPVDLAETSFVSRVPLAELADPANRVMLRYAQGGLLSPAFQVHGMLVWGFTAGILDILLRLGGWERPWNDSAVVDYPLPRAVPPAASPPPQRRRSPSTP
ncbi:CoA pyrophosphatase [Frankia sp. QA3]|uniref:NUDIX hydrolase n=1 Tax=Frankia sp. QA3 TaxID=710111 RepID=UPI001E2D9261|nr:CoA pyrophosphatase [Frankia sp. QA3]